MGDIERQLSFIAQPDHEFLDPHHFYAAYVFDRPEGRETDVKVLVNQANELGYSMRYWWLSEAMDLQGAPDRLILCVHHPSSSEDAGMDLYDALKKKRTNWDDLEAAVVEEYQSLGKPLGEVDELRSSFGDLLFPTTQVIEKNRSDNHRIAAVYLITQEDVREAAEEKLGRELAESELSTILSRLNKALEWLDWKSYLDDAIQLSQASGKVDPPTEDY